jgi:hypothetical protein
MRKLWFLAVSLSLALFSSGCGGGSTSAKSSAPPSSTLSVMPASATVPLGQSTDFSAHVASGSVPPVNWSVNGIAGGNGSVGTITSSGLYTAPATFPSNNQVTIAATAKSNSSEKGQATATIVFPNNNTRAETSPVKLGTSGGNNTDISGNMCCSGTLGALVGRGGTFFILSNNHVLDKSDQGKVGDPIGQPGLVDNNCSAGAVVAHLSQAANLQTSNVDAALAQIVSGAVDTSGSILDLGAQGNTSIAAAPPSNTLADASAVLSANEGVAKSGRSSGLTCSNLSSVSTSVQVDYDKSCGGAKAFTVVFNNQVVISGATFSASGDSGSLVVTSDTARPVGLLYAGSDTGTVANPIQDVLSALPDPNTHEVPAMVGGGDHAVSCAPTATMSAAQANVTPSSAMVARDELDRATAVKERVAQTLMSDPALTAVGVGASADEPGRAAIVIYVSGTPLKPIPAEIDGVRTKVIYGSRFQAQNATPGGEGHAVAREELQRGVAAKELHAAELLKQPGIIGVGVGRSADAPGESTVVVYVEKGSAHAPVPATVAGVRTRIIPTQRFKAFGWGHEKARPACTVKKK